MNAETEEREAMVERYKTKRAVTVCPTVDTCLTA